MVHGNPCCPKCKTKAEFVDNAEVYGESVGKWPYGWLCRRCDTYVGCHSGTRQPKGVLADRKTRQARVAAHNAFDALWREGGMSRTNAYRWLCKRMRLPFGRAHIGHFTLKQCNQLIRLCEAERKKHAPV